MFRFLLLLQNTSKYVNYVLRENITTFVLHHQLIIMFGFLRLFFKKKHLTSIPITKEMKRTPNGLKIKAIVDRGFPLFL